MEELFFELIHVAVGTADRLSHAPTEAEWQSLKQEAERQTLMGVLYAAVCRLPEEQFPPRKILFDWHSAAEKIRSDNKRLDHVSVWVSQKWAQLGYRNVILKGQGNALRYPDPSLRTPGDVDIWLDGDRDKIAKYIRGHFPEIKVTYLEMDFPVKKDTTIEIHFHPCLLFNPIYNNRLQDYFKKQLENPQKVHLQDGEICIPNNEMNLVFQLCHIHHHLFHMGIGLRQLMDYYFLIKNEKLKIKNEVDSNAVKEIDELGLMKFCRALMWVEGKVFGMPREWMLAEPDEKEGRFLLNEILHAGNFGHDDDRVKNINAMPRWKHYLWVYQWTGRLFWHYPSEVLWHPYFRISQHIWRRWKGYL